MRIGRGVDVNALLESLCNRSGRSTQSVRRALLGWSQSQLARRAGVGLATLQRIEQNVGIVKGNFSITLKLQQTLEQAGIRFTKTMPER